MLRSIVRSRKLRTIGSVIDVSPMGNYSDLLPIGSTCDRIGEYWRATDRYIGAAIDRDDEKQIRRRNRGDLTPA
jgi:hypothetical protein